MKHIYQDIQKRLFPLFYGYNSIMIYQMQLTCLVFIKAFFLSNVKSQVTTCKQVAHQIQILSVLERIVHVYQEPKQKNYNLFF